MKLLVTGANGFIGKNLCLRLQESSDITVVTYCRHDDLDMLLSALSEVEAVVHLAGENRPADPDAFKRVNSDLTETLCSALLDIKKTIPLILASSAQAGLHNPYGLSKRVAEQFVENLSKINGNPVAIYRLPGVVGKWSKPDYNSVVATFCHNIANDLPIQVNDPLRSINLVYVDDVIDSFITWLAKPSVGCNRMEVTPVYDITLERLADQIADFKNCRTSLISEPVGAGLVRALYSTYVSYLPREKFVYDLPVHGDSRGVFVEMLKTKDSGQFSFFSAHPGITRGGHYHHSKTEKFLVIKGHAKFGFRHMNTGELFYLETTGDRPQIVETVPGWTHDIKNIGTEEMIVMLWANEIFNRERPDTVACKVEYEKT